ncbi:hypothetical protein JXB02_01250 [Candidatus Woesearchaeota archaeon]|nr:hypothetical protein [Candidatus Woesearchaeota archaeon]
MQKELERIAAIEPLIMPTYKGEYLVVPDIAKKAFIGVGFGYGGVPIEVVQIVLLSYGNDDYTLLVTDGFPQMNGMPEEVAAHLKDDLISTLERIGATYGITPKVRLTSDFMKEARYNDLYYGIQAEAAKRSILHNDIQSCVPVYRRGEPRSIEYPMHEFACCAFLAEEGYKLKLGPSSEDHFDYVMRMGLGLPLEFAFLKDAYALGTEFEHKVIHDIPQSKGTNGGQRIYLHDTENQVLGKVSGNEKALRSLATIASVAGDILGREGPDRRAIEAMKGDELVAETQRLVLENIIRPYQAVTRVHH